MVVACSPVWRGLCGFESPFESQMADGPCPSTRVLCSGIQRSLRVASQHFQGHTARLAAGWFQEASLWYLKSGPFQLASCSPLVIRSVALPVLLAARAFRKLRLRGWAAGGAMSFVFAWARLRCWLHQVPPCRPQLPPRARSPGLPAHPPPQAAIAPQQASRLGQLACCNEATIPRRCSAQS